MAACVLAVVSVAAQQSYQLGLGNSRLLDTYLSQEKFSGTGLTFLSTNERLKAGRHWATLMEHELNLATVDDRSLTREELQADYSFFLGRLRSWPLAHGWTLQAGGMAALNIGGVYNTANSNNPAQARLALHLMPTGTVSKRVSLQNHDWLLRYELNLPLVGLMFSPNYGQSYYEIFSLGNYDHNAVPTTFVSAPWIRQQLSVDCQLWRATALRLSYLGDYQQSDVNHLKTHTYHHRVMLGIVRTLRYASLMNKE